MRAAIPYWTRTHTQTQPHKLAGYQTDPKCQNWTRTLTVEQTARDYFWWHQHQLYKLSEATTAEYRILIIYKNVVHIPKSILLIISVKSTNGKLLISLICYTTLHT